MLVRRKGKGHIKNFMIRCNQQFFRMKQQILTSLVRKIGQRQYIFNKKKINKYFL